jgi:tRNA(Arg) A34 adenosine deaminase TadA
MSEKSSMPVIEVALPRWITSFLAGFPGRFRTVEQRMRLVIELAGKSVEQDTGGPFGAAIFSADGTLVAPGINLVAQTGCSIFHAEMVAIMLAQKILGRYDISNRGEDWFELVTSSEPCAMCYGAIPWSGVTRVVCGARDEDARAVGFDEGEKPSDWQAALRSRGIEVVENVLRTEACAVLRAYSHAGGEVYNACTCAAGRPRP